MTYILGLDGSKWQGTNIDFNQVKAAGYQFWFQRMTYSYPGQPSKIDPTANHNYYAAKAASMVVSGYHKIGWTDPVAEADFFLAAMSPLAENDLLAHDIEPASDVAIPDNWAEFEQAYVQRIHDRTGVWSIRYLNISMNNAMPPTGVVTNCASWVAAPSYGFDADLPVHVPVMFQQGPTAHVPGITANVCDTDAAFMTMEELLKYAYHAPQPAPEPTPTPPAPEPVPTPPVPTPVPIPVPDPTPVPTNPPTPTPVTPTPPADTTSVEPVPTNPVVSTMPVKHWYDFILNFLAWLVS